jgi:Xaa-Pro aminopeptidase
MITASASGGQYRDGTCATSRTVHFGRPTQEQSDAYTRLLQGHIAIDRATFPEGTTDTELNILAHSALWKDGLNYMVSHYDFLFVDDWY